MHSILTTLIDRLDSAVVSRTNVIRWACPVPSFADISTSRVASVGLNPSNREFVDESGAELRGPSRRFHTLRSLRLKSWSEVDTRHLKLIMESCREYFRHNPYDRWFKRLDYVVSGTKASYYTAARSACHLDLIPYATTRKWTDLTETQRLSLLAAAGDTLGLLLRDSPVRILILNGKSVVREFQGVAGTILDSEEMPSWSLPRRSTFDVKGVAYTGVVTSVNGIDIGHGVLVLGFNHNLQSSFGVTSQVLQAIRRWVTEASKKARR